MNTPTTTGEPGQDYYDRLENYEPCFALQDTATGETYWRMRSKDGKRNFKVYEKSESDKKFMGPLVLCAALVMLGINRFWNDFSEFNSIENEFGWLIFWGFGAVIAGYMALFFLKLLFNGSVEKRFIKAMKAREAAVNEDTAARTATMPEPDKGTPKVGDMPDTGPALPDYQPNR